MPEPVPAADDDVSPAERKEEEEEEWLDAGPGFQIPSRLMPPRRQLVDQLLLLAFLMISADFLSLLSKN